MDVPQRNSTKFFSIKWGLPPFSVLKAFDVNLSSKFKTRPNFIKISENEVDAQKSLLSQFQKLMKRSLNFDASEG